jgi:hypothetical protein
MLKNLYLNHNADLEEIRIDEIALMTSLVSIEVNATKIDVEKVFVKYPRLKTDRILLTGNDARW